LELGKKATEFCELDSSFEETVISSLDMERIEEDEIEKIRNNMIDIKTIEIRYKI
jgi:hypothetical protein